MEQTNYNPTSSKKSSTFKNKKTFIFLLIAIFLIISFFAIQRTVSRQSEGNTLSQTDQRVNIKNPTFKKEINKSFTFPLLDQNGREVNRFTYTIETVELRDQIIVKGQEATAINGRQFLVINIKLTNNYDKSISVNSRDYLRIIIDGSPDKIAPDMHSDPVEVQAISSKSTRLGLTIDDTVEKITLQIGEISGKKESIPVVLK